jgi:transcriptional regulator with XRE-family HTH domain
MPSIEVAAKIADALEVTLDYLVKDGVYEAIDSNTLKRLKDIEKLPADLKEKYFFSLTCLSATIKQKKLSPDGKAKNNLYFGVFSRWY